MFLCILDLIFSLLNFCKYFLLICCFSFYDKGAVTLNYDKEKKASSFPLVKSKRSDSCAFSELKSWKNLNTKDTCVN